MVGLYKEQFGRGPTKARTNFAGPDIVICTLEQSLTPVERRLAELGEHQRLRDTRTYFQRRDQGSVLRRDRTGAGETGSRLRQRHGHRKGRLG